MAVSRRQLLAGVGAASAATALGVALPRAGASEGGGFDGSGLAPAALGASAFALTEGLAYLTVDPTAFGPINEATGRNISQGNGATVNTGTGGLMTPLLLPVGAVLKEVHVAYLSPAGSLVAGVWKKALTGPYVLLNDLPGGLALPTGATPQTALIELDEPITGDDTSMLLVNNVAAGTEFVHGALLGYTPPPQAFVAVNPVARVLDTRATGGKLNPNEERIVELDTPSFATAAVINLTITETEGAGFVAAFRADEPWPGNSSINWSSPDQNLANGVITATDDSGRIRIRGGVSRTNVVIDVQGYLL